MDKKVNPEKLKKGDVILTGVDNPKESLPIKLGNIFCGRLRAVKWTHVAMSLGGLDIVESIPSLGVTPSDIQENYVNKTIDIMMLRCKVLSQDKREAAADYCVNKIKQKSEYDPRALWYFPLYFINPGGLGRLIDSDFLWNQFFDKYINQKNAYFCSELIAEAFREVGFNFLQKRKSWQIMPVDFYNLKFFDKIEDIWV